MGGLEREVVLGVGGSKGRGKREEHFWRKGTGWKVGLEGGRTITKTYLPGLKRGFQPRFSLLLTKKSSTLFEARVSASLHQCVSVDLPWQPFCERKFTGGLCVCLCLSVCLIYRVFMYSHEEDMAKIIDFPVV